MMNKKPTDLKAGDRVWLFKEKSKEYVGECEIIDVSAGDGAIGLTYKEKDSGRVHSATLPQTSMFESFCFEDTTNSNILVYDRVSVRQILEEELDYHVRCTTRITKIICDLFSINGNDIELVPN